jgi:hypothetical protein
MNPINIVFDLSNQDARVGRQDGIVDSYSCFQERNGDMLLFAVDPTHPGMPPLRLPSHRNSDFGVDAIHHKGHSMQSQSLPTSVSSRVVRYMTAISLQTRSYS